MAGECGWWPPSAWMTRRDRGTRGFAWGVFLEPLALMAGEGAELPYQILAQFSKAFFQPYWRLNLASSLGNQGDPGSTAEQSRTK